ncbi:MAG: hypothetical protein C4308_03385 [Chitinophagaceae bacterium]
MRIIKLSLLSIVFLFLIITAIGFFFPSHIRVSRAIDINSNSQQVYGQLSEPANWKNWYPGGDSLQLFVENGKPKGLQMDKKTAVVVSSITHTSVSARFLHSKRNIELTWKLIADSSQEWVTVQCYMDFRLKWYPWERFSSLIFEKVYGPQLEKGLENLKNFVEQNHSSHK